MEMATIGPVSLHVEIENWPLAAPFRITGHTYTHKEFVVVSLGKDGVAGKGEAAGVRYRNETATSMSRQIEALRRAIEMGMSRQSLQGSLPPGGARNALDCALWDLEAKLTGQPAWRIAALPEPRPLLNVVTCGADEPEKMAAAARAYTHARALKLKLTGEPIDAERVQAVRHSLPHVWLSVDANQGFTAAFLERLMPVLVAARVELIEQPFPIGQEALLDGFHSPIPIAADESVQGLAGLPQLAGRFEAVNIKLDKCGGLTEALAMARAAHALGLDAWVGNMIGTSLAMAPAYIVGQLCQFVELDGPLFLQSDRDDPVDYVDGFVTCPDGLWGNPA